jgi:tetratricopeptide (TPR) repeat protein
LDIAAIGRYISKKRNTMSPLLPELSEGNFISTKTAKLMGVICSLLWLSSAVVVDGGSRSELHSTPPVALQTVRSGTRQAEVRELKQGQVIERELAAGEAHTYRITLASGQYLKAVAEQKGIDVVVRLFGPDGQKLADLDSPNGTQGPEPVSVIAETAGEYRLEVRSLEEKALAGRYEIKVEELRESKPLDRDRIALERTLGEAEQLRTKGTAESLRKAIEKYSEALPLLRILEDRQGEAATLNRIGVIYWSLGDNPKALEYYSRAQPLWHAVGDRRNEATTLHNFGVVYWQLGDSQSALEHYNQALTVWRAVGDRRGEATTLSAIGLAHNHLGPITGVAARNRRPIRRSHHPHQHWHH